MLILPNNKYLSSNNELQKQVEISGVSIEEFNFKENLKKKSLFKKEDFYKRFLTLNGAIMISKPFETGEVNKFYVSLYDLIKNINSEEVFGVKFPSRSSEKTVYKNSISFDKFTIGDIIVATSQGFHVQGAIRHAAIFDSRRYHGSIDDKCLLTAEPDQGVIYETIRFYRENFSEAWGLTVPKATIEERVKAVDEVSKFVGKPYSWRADKNDDENWYCSKVPWAAYKKSSGIDIDGNGGFWVLPIDIFISKETEVFEYSNS
ncbi:YiiX/YebB-like N1pC/P60 family cysteine hydrolase [Thermoanaerobacterium butyriciformans]|uniref:Permuted papain-like amidase YaeF/Yiix C92 family enzyme n=1 Tax=Thermoanaerobacterium butyriciformans TaxID=1702242 RepID=A0ABS4ND45_9THEO|nr:YiiX/YebB-like N1pC/P60 family cysteine hydrolase [Thermoanaerobacterium butyriciformans]MBP2071566.1 hypothetical protein [Thermoanaerobacterium butyriciformans]